MSPRRYFRSIRSKSKPWKKALAKKFAANLTGPEAVLWERLKDKQLGVWVHKQSVVLGYILDFWIPGAGICCEVDGPCHDKRKDYDAHRDSVLAKRKILTVRFTADEVNNNLPAVVALIRHKIAQRMK